MPCLLCTAAATTTFRDQAGRTFTLDEQEGTIGAEEAQRAFNLAPPVERQYAGDGFDELKVLVRGCVRLRVRPLIDFRPLRGAGRRGAVLGLYADHQGRPIRGQRRAGSADFAAGGGWRRRLDLYRRWRRAPRALLRHRGAARLRFSGMAVEPRLLCRRDPQGLPADADRCNRGLAYCSGAEPRRCVDV